MKIIPKPQGSGYQPYDQGYWNRLPNRASTRAGTNATLLSGVEPQTDIDGADSIGLWVQSVSSGFGISGTTAQSRLRRAFFARSLNQTAFTLTGQVPNQYEYGRLAEFVRIAQMDALMRSTLMRLIIPAGGIPAKHNMKGRRGPIDVIGYVEGFPRITERFVNAPTYTFPFVISRSLSGLFRDESVRVSYLKSWADIFDDPRFQAQFIDDPDLALPDERQHEPDGGLHSNRPPEQGSRNPDIRPTGPDGGRRGP